MQDCSKMPGKASNALGGRARCVLMEELRYRYIPCFRSNGPGQAVGFIYRLPLFHVSWRLLNMSYFLGILYRSLYVLGAQDTGSFWTIGPGPYGVSGWIRKVSTYVKCHGMRWRKFSIPRSLALYISFVQCKSSSVSACGLLLWLLNS